MKFFIPLLLLIAGLFACQTNSDAYLNDPAEAWNNFLKNHSFNQSKAIYFLNNELLCQAIDCNKTYLTGQGVKVVIYRKEDLFMRKIDNFIIIESIQLNQEDQMEVAYRYSQDPNKRGLQKYIVK